MFANINFLIFGMHKIPIQIPILNNNNNKRNNVFFPPNMFLQSIQLQ
jgi:hypothetical protein